LNPGEPGASDPPAAYDVVVVGGGPSGLTAALFLGRARRRVLVLDDGRPRNARSRALHGFPTRDGIPPLELLRLTRAEVEAYGVDVRHGRVVDAREPNPEPKHPRFVVKVESGELFTCRRLLLATGVQDLLPDVEGMLRFYGRGVFHCPYCDGWEVRDRRLIAFGALPGAAGLALNLLCWSPHVTLCTGGGALGMGRRRKLARNGVRVVEERLSRLDGSDTAEGALEAIVLESGRRLPADALFLSVERVQRSGLPELLGCRLDDKGNVRVRGAQHADVRGLYVVGDAVGDVQFAVVAAAEGARAAVAINKDLQNEDLQP
jgi:thioredoxin reductase